MYLWKWKWKFFPQKSYKSLWSVLPLPFLCGELHLLCMCRCASSSLATSCPSSSSSASTPSWSAGFSLRWGFGALRIEQSLEKSSDFDMFMICHNAQCPRCQIGCSCSKNLPCSNYRSISSSCSYHMEDFDYRNILFDNGDIVHCYHHHQVQPQRTPPPVHHSHIRADLVKLLIKVQIIMTMTTTLRGAAVSQVAEKLPSRALPPPLFPRQVRVGLFIAETERRLVSFAIITWNWTQSRWSSLCAAQEGDSDSEEVVHPQQQNRTRQKKFVKNFKQLPSEEVVLQREYRTKRNDKRGETNVRVLLRPDVGHSATRTPLCHWKLHRLPLKRLWLCHQSNWFIIILFIFVSKSQFSNWFHLYIPSKKSGMKGKQQTFIFSDPDPDDLNQLVHKGENGEDHSKCDRCDHPWGHAHVHLVHIKRGHLQGKEHKCVALILWSNSLKIAK